MTYQIEFNNVWKKFRKGERLNSFRDAIPYLFRRTLSKNNNNGLRQEEFWAVRDVSFQIKKGEVLGVIGPNGAGKSTILKLLSKIFVPNKGKIKISGRVGALIEIGAGFHPELTGKENVYLNGTILGMTKKEINDKYEQIVDFSEMSEFMDTPVKRYSSGMFSRLGFSVAAHMDPDIMLVDEVLSVGDTAFQAKCTQKMRELLKSNITIILVSHNLSLIQSLCKRIILLGRGKILKEGSADEVIPFYQNIIYGAQESELKNKMEDDDWKVKVDSTPSVEIGQISLLDANGKSIEQLKFGEPISIKVEFESKEKIDNPVFSLEIIRADGVLCCLSDSRGNNHLTNIIKGKASVNIGLGNFNLAPGIYLIKVSIWDKDMLHPYAIAKKDIFKIESKHIISNNAVILPEIKWESE